MEPTPPNTQSLPIGTRLEQFVIERVLGAGGFGVTYLATDSRLNRKVVIKENLPAQFCFRDPASLTVAPRHSHGDDATNFLWSLENFSKEAALLASLEHPGIVRVLHSFESLGTAYFVMPFVEGETFDELVRQIERKPFTEDELRGLLDRVLSALDHLHQRGIYHRDIKPGNILITNEGVPVLIDFGSARQRLSERSMTVVESAGYTPFEQLQSRGNVGPWSDLYALGATLVKAITGEALPNAADRAFDDPYKPLADIPIWRERFSVAFLSGLDGALQMRPKDRWQNAGEWKAHLHQSMAAKAESTVPESKVEVTASPQQAPSAFHASSPLPLPTVEERDFLLAYQMPIRMCWIPPGEFLMGSPGDELGRQPDETQHRVQITRGFWVGKYPVTQAQWRAVMGSNPSHFIGDDLPVESVTWSEIFRPRGFLEKVNRFAGEEGRFSLPTEAEWEYASRAGNSGAFAGVFDSMAWHLKNSSGKTQPVGRKKANDWGLHDIHGNVWEWCADRYGTYPEDSVSNPSGPEFGSHRVFRGGSWSNHAHECRAAYRPYGAPNNSYGNLGFRLVLCTSPFIHENQ
jgi:formylglycine-generating enzyme required for sulfatase activity